MSDIERSPLQIDDTAGLENDQAGTRILQNAAKRAGTIRGKGRDSQDSPLGAAHP